MPEQQTFTDVQPVQQTFENVTPIEQPKKYLPGRAFGMDVARGMGLDADKIAAAEDAEGQVGGLKEIGSQVLEGLKGVLKDPFNIVKAPAVNFEEAVKSGSPGRIVGALSTILGGAEAAEKGSAAASTARESVGKSLHTAEGKLTPGATTLAETAGTAIGGTIGHELLPGYGALAGAGAGYKLGPSLLDKAFPEPKSVAEARAQVELLQSKAEDLMRRGREQEALDRKAAATQRLTERQTAQAAKNAPPPSPFPNATPSNASVGNTPLPKVSDLGNAMPQGNATPFGQPQMVSKFQAPQAPEPGRILPPDTPPIHVEGSYWSFDRAALAKAVLGGDRAAAIVYKQRFGELPSGASYLSDVGASPNRGLYISQK